MSRENRLARLVVLTAIAAGCGGHPSPGPSVTPARMAPPDPVVTCDEWVMKTFTVLKSTHPTLARSVRTAVSKWKFTPAEIGGCKVARDYNGAVVLGKPTAASGGTSQ